MKKEIKILAVDTASLGCSVAVTEGNRLVSEITLMRRETHSKHLMAMITNVLEAAKLDLSEIDGFAVTKGPGSFTGLRIGISTVKGLAMASGKAIVGLSCLDVLAGQLPFFSAQNKFAQNKHICAMMDARKQEVYAAFYEISESGLKRISAERVVSPEDAIKNISEPCIFVGDGAALYRELIENTLKKNALFAPEFFNIIRASAVAFFSLSRFEKNDTDDIASFVPSYVRKSDAEINLVNNG
jgi:tRNA threonylcarbamoyladenosine biosynthesis protein TsaB